MKSDADIRRLCAELGIDDDRTERAIVEMNAAARVELQLERDRVPDRVWALEDQLLMERVG